MGMQACPAPSVPYPRTQAFSPQRLSLAGQTPGQEDLVKRLNVPHVSSLRSLSMFTLDGGEYFTEKTYLRPPNVNIQTAHLLKLLQVLLAGSSAPCPLLSALLSSLISFAVRWQVRRGRSGVAVPGSFSVDPKFSTYTC